MLRDTRHRIALAAMFLALAALVGCGGDADADEANAEGRSETFANPAETAADGPAGTRGEAGNVVAEVEPLMLADAFAAAPDLTVFGRLWTVSRLAYELEGEPLTIFAPNNAAFSGIAEGTIAGEANARSLVLRHTVTGTHDRAALTGMRQIEPRQGRALTVEAHEDGVRIGSAVIVRSFQAGDVTVHVVSRSLGETG